MKYKILDEILTNLTNKTTDLNGEDLHQYFSANDFLKKVIEISTATIKDLKKFCLTIENNDLKKYLSKEVDNILLENQNTVKLSIDYIKGNQVLDLPLNINLTYHQAKTKSDEFETLCENIVKELKKLTESKAKDTALSHLYDLKFILVNIQDRLENYDNKIADAF